MNKVGGSHRSKPKGRPQLRWKDQVAEDATRADVETGKELLTTVRTGGNS
jgi:hypothetical protein